MATINVTTWAEFVEAVGTSGADVVMPEGAVWDMNEIAPAFNQNLTIACASITGNGAEIKNLHITGHFLFTAATQVSGLAVTNIFGDGTGGGGTYQRGFFYSSANGNPAFTGCTFSGLFGSGYARLFNTGSNGKYFDLVQCAFHMDMDAGWDIGEYKARACRFFMKFLEASTVYCTNHSGNPYKYEYCEYVIYAPIATLVRLIGSGSCTLRGNMQNCTDLQASGGTEENVYDSADAPNATVSGTGAKMTGVTDSQMKDAAYLRDTVGFLIGSD